MNKHKRAILPFKRLFELLLLLLLLLHQSFGYADDTLVYRIGVENTDYYPHFSFNDNRDTFTREIFEVFFHAQQAKVVFVTLPLKRFNQWYLKDNIDFKYPDNRDWRQDEATKLPITYSTRVVQLMAGTSVPAKKLGIERQQIKRLGTILGFYPTLWIDRVRSGKTVIIDDPNVLSVIKMSLGGLVDGTNLEYSVINHHLQKLGRPKALLMDKHLPHILFGFHFSTIRHPEMIEKFNHFYENNRLLIEKLKVKYQIIENPFDRNSF